MAPRLGAAARREGLRKGLRLPLDAERSADFDLEPDRARRLPAFFAVDLAAPFLARARRRPSTSPIRPGISEGMRATGTPAASNAAIFSAAVPLPPEMIAPA